MKVLLINANSIYHFRAEPALDRHSPALSEQPGDGDDPAGNTAPGCGYVSGRGESSAGLEQRRGGVGRPGSDALHGSQPGHPAVCKAADGGRRTDGHSNIERTANMKVLLINGSPRPNGNTALALSEMPWMLFQY